MAFARLTAIIRTVDLDRRIRRAERRERDALVRAGKGLFAAEATAPELTAGDGASGLRDEILAARCRVDAFSAAIARSLEADRADYVTVSRWCRPLVVARGLCDRMVLCHQRRRSARELRPLYAQLGAEAMAWPSAGTGHEGLASYADIVRSARAEMEAARAERALCQAPFGGAAVPAWVHGVSVESRALGTALAKQLRSHFIPRASALAGLAAGWWVANTFTDSHWRSALRSFGIGRGGTHVVSADTFRAMSFWLPILSAATCAYLGDRLAHGLWRRYEGPAGQPAGLIVSGILNQPPRSAGPPGQRPPATGDWRAAA